MVNLYQLLNLPPHADAATIQTALQQAQTTNRLEPKVIKAVQEWLLKPDIRARYDAKLRQEQPEFFIVVSPQHNIPTPDMSAFTVSETVQITTPPISNQPAHSSRTHHKKTPVQQAIYEKYGKSNQTATSSKQHILLTITVIIIVAIVLFLIMN